MQRYQRFPPPWLQATVIFAFSEYTAEAADFWIELAGFNPDAARHIGGYFWRGIRERLRARGDGEKLRALAQALEAIHYDGGNEASRSALAEELFDDAMVSGDIERARTLLPRISDPDKLSEIAVSERTRALWDDVARVDDATRAAVLRRWIVGLGEAARDDGELGGRFISATTAHMGPEAVLAAYVPVLREAMADGAARQEDFGLTFWLAPLANAYAVAGDDAAAEALYREALGYFATLQSPVKLNASANLALFLQMRGRHAEALALIDESIAGMQRSAASTPRCCRCTACARWRLRGSTASPKPGARSSCCGRTVRVCPTCTCAPCSALAATTKRATCWSSNCAVPAACGR
jgi:hypothetical protein